MIWSASRIPSISPASRILLVTAISSLLGCTSPLGWLCSRMIWTARADNASRKISLGEITEVLSEYSSAGYEEIARQYDAIKGHRLEGGKDGN